MIHKLFTFPLRTVVQLGQKIAEELEQELYDLSRIQQDLLHLHLAFEKGELEDNAYKERESILLQRFQIAKDRERALYDDRIRNQ